MSAPVPAYDRACAARAGGEAFAGVASQSAAGTHAALVALSAMSALPTNHISRFIDELAQIVRCPLTVHQRETLESALAAAVQSIVVQAAEQPA